MQLREQLAQRISDRTAIVGIIGLGYVGLPLAAALHRGGLRVIGFDIDERKVVALTQGDTYLEHLGPDLSPSLAESDRFEATTAFERLAHVDISICCVPTPLGPHREPDLSFVRSSAGQIGRYARPGHLAILESTTYPGTTRDVFLPALLAARPAFEALALGRDLFIAYSPEREDPGRRSHNTQSTPKLVGGLDEATTGLAAALYRVGIDDVVPVRSAEIAEAAKLLENVFRAVNIALVNELKTVLSAMNVDVWDVIDAAATKPFGFLPFYPGPGLGGHCIPIDPFYLAWQARAVGCDTRFVELAGEVNRSMPAYVVRRVGEALNDEGKALRNSDLLVLGLAYKRDVDDTRETPAAEIIARLAAAGARVSYHDPHVPVFPRKRDYDLSMTSIDLDADRLAATDGVIVVTDHAAIDWSLVGRHARLIVDTRNAMAGVGGCKARVVKA
ncbi:MAG: nucleotide sugar dehydrogenase [Myxococcales bacterium FL481]|nr:MAG: nucleotide sugar dehydrogenase [Myxococcales bacterium FL481]